MNSRFRTLGLRLAVVAFAAAVLATPTWAIGTPAGTPISNTAQVNFTDVNGNALSVASNTVITVVSQVGGVNVGLDHGPVTLSPGDTYYFPHVITNTGNGDDYVNITASSAGGWTVAIYRDGNNNGTFEAGPDTLLADSPADAGATPDSGLLTHDTFMNILVAVTVPAGTIDGASDVTTLTGTSAFDITKIDTALDSINVTAPNVSVLKSVLPLGNQPPGTVLTYTVAVTNGGTGAANAVVLTDPIPANTTYEPGSIVFNGTPRTDAPDGSPDDADFNGTNPGQVTVSVGTLASGATATVTFQVRIN